MVSLFDKIILFVILFLASFFGASAPIGVVPVLIVISFSCFISYSNYQYFKIIGMVSYAILSIFFPELILFFPILCYDAFLTKQQFIDVVYLIPLFANFTKENYFYIIISIVFFILSYYLKYKSIIQEKSMLEYVKYRDTSKEFSIQLENKNKELLQKQDYEINIATLNERNRIAMEIHDNVGHLLSSSLLQLGAILAINTDTNIKENLDMVNQTLSTAMDTIRDSVHNIHDQTLKLEPQIETIVEHFKFCCIDLDYSITSNPNTKITYTIITIIKEALSNIQKHSNATCVELILREHPKLYQFRIQDNGSTRNINLDNGIGIKNMEHRVSSLNGTITITTEEGFKIFVSLPKEESNL